MKQLFGWMAALGLVFSVNGVDVASAADEAKVEGTKIATVDMQKALQTVDAGKKAKAQLEKEFNAKKKMLDDEERAIKKLDEEFQKQSMVLNDQAREKKVREIQERIMKFQKSRADSQMELQKREGELVAPLVTNLRGMIKDLATKKGYSLVLDKNENQVLFSSDKDDLTGELVSAYNSKHK